MTEPGQTEGQAGSGLEGATVAAPGGAEGQSVTEGQTTGSGPDTTAEDSFFDPSSIKGTPLEPAYKQMQAAYTKKSQGFAANRQKIEAYEQFERNPQGTLQQLAQAYGFQLVQRGQQQNGTNTNEKWEPQTWDDVMSRAKQEAKADVMKELQPVLGPVFDEVKKLRKSNIENSLDDIDPQWRLYEDDMARSLDQHPTLALDPERLYRMSVPQEVIMAKATKQALEKLQGRTNTAQVSGGSTTTKQSSQVRTAKTFAEAVELAKAQLAEKGMRAPSGA